MTTTYECETPGCGTRLSVSTDDPVPEGKHRDCPFCFRVMRRGQTSPDRRDVLKAQTEQAEKENPTIAFASWRSAPTASLHRGAAK